MTESSDDLVLGQPTKGKEKKARVTVDINKLANEKAGLLQKANELAEKEKNLYIDQMKFELSKLLSISETQTRMQQLVDLASKLQVQQAAIDAKLSMSGIQPPQSLSDVIQQTGSPGAPPMGNMPLDMGGAGSGQPIYGGALPGGMGDASMGAPPPDMGVPPGMEAGGFSPNVPPGMGGAGMGQP